MSLSRFFIDRPIFAWVISLIIMLVGGLSIFRLPISQYPSIAPPQIAISVTYPGASADTVNDTVVRPILQQMFGLDHLEYISAQSYASGQMEIDLTFAQGTDPDIAQVQVQNKLQLAQPKLPTEVTAQGLSITKAVKNFMLVVAFISTDGSMNGGDIADYVASNISDPLSRVSGVGDHTLFGSEYSMRIWMDPAKLFNYGLTVRDVETAIQTQNIQLSSGELGGLPATKGIRLDATIIGPQRLTSPEEFQRILLKVQPDGSQVRIRDIAKVELGPQTYNTNSYYNNMPASGMALKLAPGANQIATEAAVRAQLHELEQFFPPGLKTVYPLDTEPFITLSIGEVVETLLEAIGLVFLVMLVFLQNFRATLIPTIAVPVVLLGTFGLLNLLGYSINTLTMLAMVLAVGLLVDDAIVVVENVERVMTEKQLSPREAARVSMDEISGALVGIVLVLSAVFLPMAAFSGSVGVIYRQFSITIVSAMWLSVLVAMVLTPALCATMLKPGQHEKTKGLAGWFNRNFTKLTNGYLGGVNYLLRHFVLAMGAFVLITAVVVVLFLRVPGGFLPDEDQGLIFGQITMPPNAPMEKTAEINHAVADYILKTEADSVESVYSVNGFNFAGQGQNSGAFFIRLKDWSVRPKASQSSAAIAMRIMMHFWGSPKAQILAFNPPAVLELGNATGFDLELEDRAHLGHEKLLEARNMVLGMAAQDPSLLAVRPNGMEDAGQYHLDIDREKANALGVTIDDINTTIEGALGSIYVNQFTRNDRVKQVYIQGVASSRMQPQDLDKWYIRNFTNTLVPLNTFVSAHWISGPQKVENYNSFNAFEILGQPAEGYSSGQALATITNILKKLPAGIGYEWTGLSFEQNASGSSTGPLYALAMIVILLCLAALYESWAIPLAVLLVIPLGVVGAIIATLMRGLANDVYFQVGLLTTVGLAVKNAILIVEFAKMGFEQGKSLEESVLTAARERLRPILMTSIAFVVGVFPLAIASGAGSAARVAIGTAVVGGMASATLLAVYFVPVFFVVVLRLFKVKRISERTDPHAQIMNSDGHE
ncbi:multidrug efflux RND transporter permease subunit [Acetobacter pasteurianus]|uniref:Efflux pump membrane transporter n=1 Tax=Acetobacter pasteurianus NBRC 3278 TaxID=1226660 RepID=A0A401WZN1_ACEPA|nr:efflux RND transporter permease subunit [Acetobacter pasteurianus]BAU37216.1 RND superfamily multidrug efflux pump acriflavin resistance protein [Acetobacter pasteurianus NBRC 101655]CCT59703.1 acriflavine resistance protein [Acetobacter pasteurianus 386B]GAB30325.1 multidrug efflux pump acriflavin resistance protein AcrB/AcrD/AcrF [Acetobacter pasteurianus subsp. pasteurianus LMG 1262 = NBRC 106471]GCD48592.1 RND superfamily multidrug efflux pump acriflavin resistance protein [Acetobacter p